MERSTMEYQVVTVPWQQVAADWLVVGLTEPAELPGPVSELDRALEGSLTRLREAGDLTGKYAELLAVPDARGLGARRLLLVGLGKPGELTAARLDKALSTAARHVSEKKDRTVAVACPRGATGSVSPADFARAAATAFTVGCVGQNLYQAEPNRFPLTRLTLAAEAGGDADALREASERGRVLGEAVNLTRELVNRPADEIYPESLARRAAEIAAAHGIACRVLEQPQLEAEKMGALLAVARGSDRPPRVVVLDYRGAGDATPVLGLCGKGVTFDSGGLSIKSNENMLTMKGDMAGAATVLGTMAAIARLKLPVNVRGFLGLVENMVSGRSYKLGDVLVARNGVTIEVLNTDAEGRLVLADVLSYAVDSGVSKLIDLATLTGACVVALGEEVTGVFANNADWQEQVLAAARRAGEDAWPLPMFEHFSELLKSDVADCKNVGTRWGGAITAAKFLEKFVGETPWVHLDIAGPAFASGNKPHREGGASGCMVRTLVEVAGG
jgi:leucyl aminopeptidase